MNKLSTGLIIGGIIGVSSIALMNMDKRDVRKMQRRGRNIVNKAEGLMDDIKSYM